MTDDQDDVVLSEGERRLFAQLEAELSADDPVWSAGLMGGRPPVPLFVALAMLVVGATVMVATFARWLWVAAAGVLVMGLGLALLCVAVRDRVFTGPRDGGGAQK